MTTIRPMTRADAAAVADLLGSSFPEALTPHLPYAQRGTAAFLTDQVEDRSKQFLVADSDGHVAGFAEFRHTGGDEAFLSYVCVSPDFRRQGIARQILLGFVEDHPRVRTVTLDVFDDNVPAATMYAALGFVPVAETAWYRRPLPPPSTPLAADLAAGLTQHERYGFSKYAVVLDGRALEVGRVGPSTLRCFDASTFADDAALARLRATFPGVTDALIITDPSLAHEMPADARRLTRSHRMQWDLRREGVTH